MHNTLFLLRDNKMIESDHPLRALRKSKILLFVGIQWFVFAIAVAVSQPLGVFLLEVG